MSEFRWKGAAAKFRKHDVREVGEALTRVREQCGKLDPSDIVEASANRKSVLHRIIPQGDKEAARIGREAIASSLIRSIVLRSERAGGKPIDTRAFVSVRDPSTKKQTYQGIEETMATEEGREYLLRRAWLQLKSWRQCYADLSELAEVFDAIDAALERRSA